jgi:prolyl oligopeptidase
MELQRFDPVSGRLRLWQRPASVPEAVRQAQVSQAWFTSADGTRVPMFLLRPQGLPQDGSAAFVLEGYGGFGASLLPRYSPLTAALLQAGFGVALPSLRGGGEYGEAWHQGGMLLNKQNTFDDFAAAARYLAEQRYSSPKRLAILGNSNGGLLVAAALTQHPELFGAAICGSPLTDMLRYPRFGEGAAWVSEYGDPADEAQFKALAAYSPYHHVTAGTAYPPTLIYCAEDDDRVDPMHARKFAAALQSAQAGPGPVLLRTQRHAGHGGAGSTSGRQGLLAQELTFLQSALACPGAAPAMRALGPGSKP